MSYDGREVANFVLDQCEVHARDISHLSLQKIVYFGHVWSLIKLGRPLIKHSFEAWEFGPVLPYLYRDFKSAGSGPLRARARRLDARSGERTTVAYSFDASIHELLVTVTDFYSRLTAAELVRMSHLPGSPWYQVWNHAGKANPGMLIRDEAIVEFYSTTSAPFLLECGTYQ